MDDARPAAPRLLPLVEPPLALAFAAAGSVALYGRALGAGFMFDEPFDLPRAGGRSVAEVLTSAGDWQYFRPLPLLLWKAAYQAQGRYDPLLLHGVVLAVHAVNAWLVYLLGKQLGGRALGAVAALLFLVFPFNYQTVMYVDGLYHALATAGVLGATLLYRRARLAHGRGAARALLGLALCCAAAALLSYEDGVAVVVTVAAMEALLRAGGRAKAAYLAPSLFLLESLAFLLYRQAVPRWQPAVRLDPASLAADALYFLQGLIDPVAAHLAAAPRLAGGPAATLLAAGAATLALLLLGAGRHRRRFLAGFALVWCLAALLPAALALPWAYVQNAPRLLYLASAGIALLWAAALAPVWGRGIGGRKPPARGRLVPAAAGALALLLVGGITAQSVQFVRQRLALQALGAIAVNQLIATATAPGAAAGRVYVNFPSWLAFQHQGYLLGSTGVTMVPDYIGLGRAVYVRRGVEPDLASLAYPAQPPRWDDFVGLHGQPATPALLEQALRQGGTVYRARYATGALALEYLGRLDAGAPPPAVFLARFGDWTELAQAAVRRRGNVLAVDMVWYALKPPPPNATVFLLASPADGGAALGEANGDPIGNMLALQRWRPGDRIADCRRVTLPPGAPAARVQVWLADPATGLRVPAVAAGSRLTGNVLTLPAAVGGADSGAGC